VATSDYHNMHTNNKTMANEMTVCHYQQVNCFWDHSFML